MQRCLTLPFVLALMVPSPASGQSQVYDEFDANDLNSEFWCPCQIMTISSPIIFPVDPNQPGDRIARIVVDEVSLGGNVCRRGPPEFECQPPGLATFVIFDEDEENEAASGTREPLGPTFIRPPDIAAFRAPLKNPYCTEVVLRRAMDTGEEGLCIQRQELRLQKRYTHNANEPHFYSFRFRMPEEIEDRATSIRWVTAQWKQEPVSESYRRQFGRDWAPSPFLAQRFDDGVLHVTVQDEHCRCMVASAPYPDGSVLDWNDGRAQYCASTKPREEGQTCTPIFTSNTGRIPFSRAALDTGWRCATALRRVVRRKLSSRCMRLIASSSG